MVADDQGTAAITYLPLSQRFHLCTQTTHTGCKIGCTQSISFDIRNSYYCTSYDTHACTPRYFFRNLATYARYTRKYKVKFPRHGWRSSNLLVKISVYPLYHSNECTYIHAVAEFHVTLGVAQHMTVYNKQGKGSEAS